MSLRLRDAASLAAGALAVAAAPGTARALTAAAPNSAAGILQWSDCAARFAKAGLPRSLNDDGEATEIGVCRKGYAVAFDPQTRTPLWVMERLTSQELAGSAQRSNRFLWDPATGPQGPKDSDYTGSHYDRGHQAPAADAKYDQLVMDQSFYFSNMAPQTGLGLNRGVWAKLEDRVRSWVVCDGRGPLDVITGPIHSQDVVTMKNQGRVRIPAAFFKIAYDEASGRVTAVVFENRVYNSMDPGAGQPTSIQEIERRTGVSFLTALPARRQSVLKTSAPPLWGLQHTGCKTPSD